MYRIREVDASDDDVADTLAELHQLTFLDAAPVPKFDQGHWWLAFRGAEPVAFAGIIPSTHVFNAGYFCRVGVLGKHCGHGLQLRLMRAVEARARLNGSSPTPQTTCTPPTTSFARAIACSAPGIPGPGRYALLAQERKIALTRCVPQVAFTRSVAFWPPSFFAFWGPVLWRSSHASRAP